MDDESFEDLESPRNLVAHFRDTKPSIFEYPRLAIPGQRDPLEGIYDRTRGSLVTGASLESDGLTMEEEYDDDDVDSDVTSWPSSASTGTQKIKERWIDSRCGSVVFGILRLVIACYCAAALSNAPGVYFDELWERKTFALIKTTVGLIGMYGVVSLRPKVTDMYLVTFASFYGVALLYPIVYSAIVFGFHADFVRSWCELAGQDCAGLPNRSARSTMVMSATYSLLYILVGFVIGFQFTVFARICRFANKERRENGYHSWESLAFHTWSSMHAADFDCDGDEMLRVKKNDAMDNPAKAALHRNVPGGNKTRESISEVEPGSERMYYLAVPWRAAKSALFLKHRPHGSARQSSLQVDV
eukprot:GEMP01025686.1.p1 GENE.GEMP01025686.1~~GEMP01025686.1.p1  ORF type:complete len:358 (+),score=51.10 GEMP01025686.1:314-1387(+)